MAESFAQRTRVVNQSLRRIRQAYRKGDSAGEMFERELDRLINRKTIVNPESLVKLGQYYEAYCKAINLVDTPLADTFRLSSGYS